jgi:hypothetical protein
MYKRKYFSICEQLLRSVVVQINLGKTNGLWKNGEMVMSTKKANNALQRMAESVTVFADEKNRATFRHR